MRFANCYGDNCGPILPWWSAVLIGAAAILMVVLIVRHKAGVLRHRVADVERVAATAGPEFAPARVRAAAEELFRARVEVKSLERIDYVGLSGGRAVVAITARHRNGRAIFEYWTLAHGEAGWAVAAVESQSDGRHQLEEPLTA